jgi:hypothetical protein
MNIYHTINSLEPSYTYFLKPIENKLSCYKYYYKLAYNIENFVLNTILINVDIINHTIIKENNNYKLVLQIDNNFLLKLKDYELNILTNINKIINKQFIIFSNKYIINNTITYNYNIKPNNVKLYLRISGIWESDTQYGFIIKLHH